MRVTVLKKGDLKGRARLGRSRTVSFSMPASVYLDDIVTDFTIPVTGTVRANGKSVRTDVHSGSTRQLTSLVMGGQGKPIQR